MSTKQTNPRIPNPLFRVLVIGRANAGKTTILQRVCDTTESPTIYRRGKHGGREEVRGPNFTCESDLTADQVKLDPSMGVSDSYFILVCPLTWCQRGEHIIDDELVFSNHSGYVFHDSRGIESGGIDELETLKEFIRRKCGETKLQDKLHAIWFAVPFHVCKN
jgi:GTPase SAR1 family protein